LSTTKLPSFETEGEEKEEGAGEKGEEEESNTLILALCAGGSKREAT
jgi:hypothetical protein